MSDGGCFDALEVTSEQTLPETVQGPREYVCAASRRLIDAAKQTETEVLRTL